MTTPGNPQPHEPDEQLAVAALKLPRRLLALVDEAARRGTRTRSKQLLRYTLEGLRRDGLLNEREAA